MNIFDTLTTIGNYELSYLELMGVLTGIGAVYLASKEKVINFWIGLVNNVLYGLIFFHVQLYGLMILQGVFFAISSYGIFNWSRKKPGETQLRISRLTNRTRLLLGLLIAALGTASGWGMIQLAKMIPGMEMPALPYIDGIVTVGSIVGQLLLAQKKLDNWLLWTVINVASVILYAAIGIYFTSALYLIFLTIGIRAFFEWNKTYKEYKDA